MQFQPLGDQAVLAYFPSEDGALAFAHGVRGQTWSWLVDVVQAYTSVAVFFDMHQVNFNQVRDRLQNLSMPKDLSDQAVRRVEIPCCYELGLDLERISEHTGLSQEQIVEMHAGREYTVYAIGFCPGFPYLGYLPDALAGVPRLPSPRLRLEAGSVGLTGRQTGIYTEVRPGGWNIVGRTPLELVHVADGYFPLRTGDRVRFLPISKKEFEGLQGRRLDSPALKEPGTR